MMAPVQRDEVTIAVPADPALLRRFAAILRRGQHWRALAMVLRGLHQVDSGDWKALLEALVAAHLAGSPEFGAIANELAAVAVLRRAILRSIVRRVLLPEHGPLLEVFADSLNRADAGAAIKVARDLHAGGNWDGLRRWAQATAIAGWSPVQVELAYAQAMEFAGQPDVADRAYAMVASRLVVESSPRIATPTPSTRLYRNPPLLETLAACIVHRVDTRGSARVHVGAVSTGEEVYSLATLIESAGYLGRIELSASDIDPTLVRRARTGVVERSSEGAKPAGFEAAYFVRQKDGRLRLIPDLRKAIRIEVRDLMRPQRGGPLWDVCIANNLLVHFSDAGKIELLNGLVASLAPDGILCIGGLCNDPIEEALRGHGLFPVRWRIGEIHEAWRIQRNAWYTQPRPYWALPPCRFADGMEWRYAAVFARTRARAAELEAYLGSASSPRHEWLSPGGRR